MLPLHREASGSLVESSSAFLIKHLIDQSGAESRQRRGDVAHNVLTKYSSGKTVPAKSLPTSDTFARASSSLTQGLCTSPPHLVSRQFLWELDQPEWAGFLSAW